MPDNIYLVFKFHGKNLNVVFPRLKQTDLHKFVHELLIYSRCENFLEVCDIEFFG